MLATEAAANSTIINNRWHTFIICYEHNLLIAQSVNSTIINIASAISKRSTFQLTQLTNITLQLCMATVSHAYPSYSYSANTTTPACYLCKQEFSQYIFVLYKQAHKLSAASEPI